MIGLQDSPRARRLTVVGLSLSGLALTLAAVRQAVWGGGYWTDWALPVALISILGTSALARAGARPRLVRWLGAANLALVAAVVAGVLTRAR